MSQDVSGFGGVINIIADQTFPTGFTVSQFSDDADPVDITSVKFADTAMGVNGDLIVWEKAVPIPMTLSVIPGTPDDINLQILANANRAAEGRFSAGDNITANVIYPDGSQITLFGGKMTDAPFGKSISSGSRLKTMTYGFMFQDVVNNS